MAHQDAELPALAYLDVAPLNANRHLDEACLDWTHTGCCPDAAHEAEVEPDVAPVQVPQALAHPAWEPRNAQASGLRAGAQAAVSQPSPEPGVAPSAQEREHD